MNRYCCVSSFLHSLYQTHLNSGDKHCFEYTRWEHTTLHCVIFTDAAFTAVTKTVPHDTVFLPFCKNISPIMLFYSCNSLFLKPFHSTPSHANDSSPSLRHRGLVPGPPAGSSHKAVKHLHIPEPTFPWTPMSRLLQHQNTGPAP